MADIHRRGLTRSNSGLLQSAKYSDLTVRCGSEEFKIHRAIVCPRSTFFAAACDGQFQEAKTSLIFLEEDDLPTVSRMLTYLYTLEYDDDGPLASAKHYMANGTRAAASEALTTTNMPLSAADLLRHAKMMNNVAVYAIAQKYDINELKELATVKFCDLLWLEAPTYAFPDIISAVFETSSITDPGLRFVAAKYCAHYSTQILADDHLSGVINDYGDLGLDVLRKLSEDLARKLNEERRLREQLVTLKGELAHTVKRISVVEATIHPVGSVLATIFQEIKTTYNNLKIESDESAKLGESDEDDESDEED